MRQPPSTSTTATFHAEFNRLTRQTVRYDMSRHFVWEVWLAAGYSLDDLKLVVAYIWRRIKAGKRERESFKLPALIGDLSRFEDDLAVARSEATVASKCRPVNAPAASVRRSAGIPDKVAEAPAKSAEQILRDAAFVKQHLAEWRKANA